MIFVVDSFSGKTDLPVLSPTPVASNTDGSVATTTSGFVATISMDTISRHNVEKDCWSLVFNNVYDLTEFIGLHPGGRENIIEICGTDGTKAFESGPHTMQSLDSISTYFRGILK